MKFARYDDGSSPRAGVLGEDERLHPLASGLTVEALIERGGLEALLTAGTDALAAAPGPSAAAVRLLAPLLPASIRDSVSFEAHIEGARRSQEGATDPVPARWYEAPCFYFTNPHACIGARDDVQRFPGSELFDLECEVGVVYGAHTLGPYLVTADELTPYRTPDGFLDLTMRAYINGELLGEDSLANMAWTFEELISFASRGAAVAPGDLLASGTCHRGCLTEIWGRAGERVPPPLVPGDVVTLEVEGLGTVRNRVIDAAPCPPIPPARRAQPRGPRH